MLKEDGVNIPVNDISWNPAWRIISTRIPTVNLFERVADPEDFEILYELEMLTNPRIRDEVGDISLIAKEDRICGHGATYVMGAFAHPNPAGSRFSDGNFGIFYAACTIKTAIEETTYHRAKFLNYTKEPPMELHMKVLTADIKGKFHDIRGLKDKLLAIYSPDSYTDSNKLAIKLKDKKSWGIAYDSVRDEGGECLAVMRPPVVSNCNEKQHLYYYWDGSKIADVYEKKKY